MRVTKEQAQASRRRIVETASELFRDKGFEGIGVVDLMKASGMTHGGFYRHFASKDDLLVEATGLAYQQLERDTQGKSVEALLRSYISDWHRDDLAHGCPTSALGGDAMRQADKVQDVFAQGVERWISMIGAAIEGQQSDHAASADHPGQSGSEDHRAKAIDLAIRAVGSIVLARAAAADRVLSDEILKVGLDDALEASQPHRA